MKEVKRTTIIDRIKNAIKAFMGKPLGSFTYGIEIKKCSECGYKKVDDGTVLYLCDRRACDECNDYCEYTHDVKHAVNFKNVSGVFVEDYDDDLTIEEDENGH